MPFTPLRRLALIAAAFGALGTPAMAQQALVAEPANLPPESFTGDQFVDNNGCIFVRAGFDGNTTWVPRVTRSREPICGQEPTFDATAVAAAEPDEAPETEDTGADTPADTAPTASSDTTATASADIVAPKSPRTLRPQATVPPRIVRSVPRDRAVRAPRGPSLPDLSPMYRTASAPASAADSPSTVIPARSWIVPRHVYENRVERGVTVPPGYEPAWKDDRLNPWRAWQKIDGYRATQRIWTDTVPRRRIPPDAPATVDDPTVAYRITGPAPRSVIRVHPDGTRYAPVGHRW
jgi:pyruvate/2-oxoglutarate dehydrogenase complex dihydrolipoamide acyltransferase (E2) component